jgi:abortive infection bacteriophage resistance protein
MNFDVATLSEIIENILRFNRMSENHPSRDQGSKLLDKKMGHIATTLDEQVEILRSRGMELDLPTEKVKEILGDIGYYRLGFYWHPFEIDSQHNFRPGTKFSECVELYYFDNDLRQILVRYTNRIEINFRTKLVYEGSSKFKNDPKWFINTSRVHGKYVSGFIVIYNKLKEDNKFLKRHHKKYPYHKVAPAWKTIEFLSFGSVFNLYKALKDEELKKLIAAHYGIKKFEKLQNYLGTTLFIRNSCAHGAVIFDLHTPLEIEKLPFIQFNNDDRHSVDSVMKIIHFLLLKISANRASDFIDDVDSLVRKRIRSTTVMDVVKEKMNYVSTLKNVKS